MRTALSVIFPLLLLCAPLAAEVTWSMSAPDMVNDRVIAAQGKALFTSYGGKAYALAADTGAISWIYDAQSNVVLEPAMPDGATVAIASGNGRLALLNFGNGRVDAEAELGWIPTAIAAGGGMTYLAHGPNLTAVGMGGELEWNASFRGTIGQMEYSEGRLYFAAGGMFYSVNGKTGKADWETQGSDSFLARPFRLSRNVYFGGTDGKLYAVDASSGIVKWFFRTGGWIMSPPFATPDAVYFSSNDGYFYSLSPFGQKRFAVKLPGSSWTQPAVYSSGGRTTVVVGCNDGKLYGFDANSGQERWSFSPYGKPLSPLLFGQNVLFGTDRGRVYSLSHSPLCSFTYPQSMEIAGNWPITVDGKASADAGVAGVEVRAQGREWVAATGKETWSASVDLTGIEDGTLNIECRARDKAGKIESGSYSTLTLVKSETAPVQRMSIIAPQSADYQKAFIISARDSRGSELRKVKIKVGTEEMVADSPFNVTLGKGGLVSVYLEKPGFEPASFTVNGTGGGDLLLPALLAIALVAAAAYFLFGKKLLAKIKKHS